MTRKTKATPKGTLAMYAYVLAATMKNPTADDVAKQLGVERLLAMRMLGMLYRLKLLHKHNWFETGRPKRWTAHYGFGPDGDEPCPGFEIKLTRPLSDVALKLATIKQLTDRETLTMKEIVEELKVHECTAWRLVRTLREHRLLHVKVRIYDGIGHPQLAYKWGPGRNAGNKPPTKEQMREWKAASAARAEREDMAKRHIHMIHLTAGNSDQARIAA